jgi:hypothetical protein
MTNVTSLITEVPILINAMKRLLDSGEEILVLKHIYDLSEKEVNQILDLYEINEGVK